MYKKKDYNYKINLLFLVGPLCLSKHNGRDRRRDDDFVTFKQFNRTLINTCEPGTMVYNTSFFLFSLKKNSFSFNWYNFFTGEGGNLEITPNSTWPDIVYYNSFTHANMGWKIHIVDSYSSSNAVVRQLSLILGITAVFLHFL